MAITALSPTILPWDTVLHFAPFLDKEHHTGTHLLSQVLWKDFGPLPLNMPTELLLQILESALVTGHELFRYSVNNSSNKMDSLEVFIKTIIKVEKAKTKTLSLLWPLTFLTWCSPLIPNILPQLTQPWPALTTGHTTILRFQSWAQVLLHYLKSFKSSQAMPLFEGSATSSLFPYLKIPA